MNRSCLAIGILLSQVNYEKSAILSGNLSHNNRGRRVFSQRGVKQFRLDGAVANVAARRLFSLCPFRLSTMEMLIELGRHAQG